MKDVALNITPFNSIADFNNHVDEVYESGRLKERFFNSSTLLNCVIGADGFIRHANDAWINLLGYPRKELERINFPRFLHPEDKKLSDDIYTFYTKYSKPAIKMFVNRYKTKEGNYVKLQWFEPDYDTETGLFLFTCYVLPEGAEGVTQYINGYQPFNWE